MAKKQERTHPWVFVSRFRRNGFGYRASRLAVQRLEEAVTEISGVARFDPALAGEGAVRFLEKISPALEGVDSSSGALGSAVDGAIEALVPIIAQAPIAEGMRDRWLERLWQAVQDDDMPYLEHLPPFWGDLCVTADRALRWAEQFLPIVRICLAPPDGKYQYFKGVPACFSALLKAGRHDEILALLGTERRKSWSNRRWGVEALAAQGRVDEAVRFAEESRGLNQSDASISGACERVLLASGRSGEAYRRYAVQATWKPTYLATFRTVVKKYPAIDPGRILDDLIASTPGAEGKWFAAARQAGMLDKAIEIANRSPCDPKTLTRAARDLLAKNPRFALEAGLAAVRWLLQGFGYETTGHDVQAACGITLAAARQTGAEAAARKRIEDLLIHPGSVDHSFAAIVRDILALPRS